MRLGKKNAGQHLQRNFGRYCFQLSDTITTNSFNPEIFNQVNVEGLIRDVGEEEVMRLLKKVVENNQKILELQKQLAVAVRMDAEKKRRE